MTMSKLNRNTHIEEFSKCADNATEGKHVNTPQISQAVLTVQRLGLSPVVIMRHWTITNVRNAE